MLTGGLWATNRLSCFMRNAKVKLPQVFPISDLQKTVRPLLFYMGVNLKKTSGDSFFELHALLESLSLLSFFIHDCVIWNPYDIEDLRPSYGGVALTRTPTPKDKRMGHGFQFKRQPMYTKKTDSRLTVSHGTTIDLLDLKKLVSQIHDFHSSLFHI